MCLEIDLYSTGKCKKMFPFIFSNVQTYSLDYYNIKVNDKILYT